MRVTKGGAIISDPKHRSQRARGVLVRGEHELLSLFDWILWSVNVIMEGIYCVRFCHRMKRNKQGSSFEGEVAGDVKLPSNQGSSSLLGAD